ncbi:MAG: ATP-binding protein [Clostridium sp.]|nr:ATP-binding protein [Clostridium sp.]MCI7012914.1 ATP-binding protein [Clostridium sp.]MDY5001338.1 ATP-binding protein [Eubacteriales bacterium]
MKRKVFLRLAILALVVEVISVAVCAFIYLNTIRASVKGSLAQCAELLAGFSSEEDYIERLQQNTPEGIRITLIGQSGDVLFDSMESAISDNHLNRPEVVSALEDGSGYAVRTSEANGLDMHYYALRLDGGMILRVSMFASGINSFIDDALPLMLALSLVVVVIALIMAKILTDRLVEPIEKLSSNPDATEMPYPELRPFAEQMEKDRYVQQHMEMLRREFTANVSHELKTPLTGISGYAEMIETGIAKPEDVQDFAGKIRKEALRLLGLVGDIIRLSELDSAEKEEDAEQVDILELAEENVERLNPIADSMGVSVTVDGEPCYVTGSRKRLDELVFNLIDNAVRYNKADGSVAVSVKNTEANIIFAVADTGIGIPSEARDRVFERFYRVDKSRSKRDGGTGLGLAIVKRVAMLYGAEIRLESEENVGTTVSVRFPK